MQNIRVCSLCLIPSWDDAAAVNLTWGESSSQKDEHNSVAVLGMVKSQGQEEVGFWNESLWACKQWMLSSTSQQFKLVVSIHVCLRSSVTLRLLIPVTLPLTLTIRGSVCPLSYWEFVTLISVFRFLDSPKRGKMQLIVSYSNIVCS